MLAALVISFALASDTVGVGWTYPPEQRECFERAARTLERTLEDNGYRVREAPEPEHAWVDIQVGTRRESEPHATTISVFRGEQAVHTTVDGTTCGDSLQSDVTNQVLALLSRPLGPDWVNEVRPYSYYTARHDRYRGQAQPLELGVLALFPGSSAMSIGVSARTNATYYGLDVALGPDFSIWHSQGMTVYEPALTAGFHSFMPLRDSLAWSWGLELGAVLDIYDTDTRDGVKAAARFGVPLKFGVAYSHAVLTVMPFLRTGGLELRDADGDVEYEAERWGILARVAWGVGGVR